MSDLVLYVLTPTVVAAVVSGAAMLAREWLAGSARERSLRRRTLAAGRRSRARLGVRRQSMLQKQISLLWEENARLRRREGECEQRYRDLEARFAELERRCDRLRGRIDRLTRLLAPGRRGRAALARPRAVGFKPQGEERITTLLSQKETTA